MDSLGNQFGSFLVPDDKVVVIELHSTVSSEVEHFGCQGGSNGLLGHAGDHRSGFSEVFLAAGDHGGLALKVALFPFRIEEKDYSKDHMILAYLVQDVLAAGSDASGFVSCDYL